MSFSSAQALGTSAGDLDGALRRAGTGAFQRRLLMIFGLVWAADAMQVIAVGFTAPSIAGSFGLTMPVALQTGTAFFLGMFIGAALFGRLADRFGRRRVLLATVALDAVFGFASVFAPDFAWLLAFRFLTGLAVGGTLPVDYTTMAEFLPADRRGRWLVIMEGFWAVGTVAVALVAWAAASAQVEDAWRWIFAGTALPALIGLAVRAWVPESPFYLARSGRIEEARAVLDRVAAGNGNPPVGASLDPALAARKPASETGGGIFSPALRRRSVLVFLVWLLVSTSYYGVFTWLPGRFATEGYGFVRGYGFLVLVALAQVPGYALAAYGVERWGRKPTLIGFLILSAASCALFAAASDAATVAAALLVMSFALLGTWGALYAITPELFPTRLRGSGMGTAGAFARLGGLAAPTLLAPVFAAGMGLAVSLFAAFLLFAAVAAFLIDAETRGAALE
ncbi:MFS transporter [Antarcticirhabdus aurantiaca]|uniref:MFS transporter n=1 Tax=Antarcticirhabdus aurantiaca TaxID=2606717 RepID=A0ACD4NQS9_9HYPH|nr:MFS transporter [Antarcticirhabdus aurantiaca]WAJ29279.1 MFS transporter [Jeongeuplla avenae]